MPTKLEHQVWPCPLYFLKYFKYLNVIKCHLISLFRKYFNIQRIHFCCNHEWIYCESILFRGAQISSFEDDGHIHGYLTSWIALPTKLKTYKIITFNFWQMRNWGLTLKQGQLRNYGLASDSSYCLTSRLKILIHGSRSMFSQPSLIRRLLWHQTVN